MNTCCFYNGLHRIAPMHCSRDFPRILFSYSSSSAAVAGCPFLSIGVNLSVSYVYSCLRSWDDFLIVQNVDELEKHNVSWGLVLCTSHKFSCKEKGLALKWQKVGFVTFNVLCPHLWALTFPCFTLSIGCVPASSLLAWIEATLNQSNPAGFENAGVSSPPCKQENDVFSLSLE